MDTYLGAGISVFLIVWLVLLAIGVVWVAFPFIVMSKLNKIIEILEQLHDHADGKPENHEVDEEDEE